MTQEPTYRLPGSNADLVAVLRKEAAEVKDCAAKYSLQGMMFVGAVLAAIATLQQHNWTVSFACIPLVLVLRAMAKTCVHKYSTANRNLGYELHLERLLRISQTHREYRTYFDIGWEEAMRAWRFVQATVFERIYDTRDSYERIHKGRPIRRAYLWIVERVLGGSTGPNIYKKETSEELRRLRYVWFAPRKNRVAGSSYHAGIFLNSTLKLLHTLTWFSLFPVTVAIPQALVRHYVVVHPGTNLMTLVEELWQNPALMLPWIRPSTMIRALFTSGAILPVLVTYVFVDFVFRQHRWDGQRLYILENELLSIHSCSIVWHAVVAAHLRAHEATVGFGALSGGGGGTYEGYTRNLAMEAAAAGAQAFHIHNYIDRDAHARSLAGEQVRNCPRRYLAKAKRADLVIPRNGKPDEIAAEVIQVSLDCTGVLVRVSDQHFTRLSPGERLKLKIREENIAGCVQGYRGRGCLALKLDKACRALADVVGDKSMLS